MCKQNRILPTKSIKLFQRFLFQRSVLHHLIRDPCQFCDLGRNRHLWIDKCVKTVHHFTVANAYRTYFRDSLLIRAQTGCLNIKGDEFVIQRVFGIACDRWNHVVDEIRLNAVDHLKFSALSGNSLQSIHRVWECLCNAMVCNRNGRLAPFIGAINQVLRRTHAIHTGHIGVQMQFHTLFRSIVYNLKLLYRRKALGTQNDLMVIFVIFHIAAHND